MVPSYSFTGPINEVDLILCRAAIFKIQPIWTALSAGKVKISFMWEISTTLLCICRIS